MNLFISPHNDDETLFGAFTILRERLLVVVVTDGTRQPGIDAKTRRAETAAAMKILGAPVHFLGIPDHSLAESKWWEDIVQLGSFDRIYAPAFEVDSHPDHQEIGRRDLPNCTRYLTYGPPSAKSRGVPVPYKPEWVALKLRALACYPSQAGHPGGHIHFLQDLYEYYRA